jgi:hypothetical protein
MTPEEWLKLEAGQTIYGKTNTPREILTVNRQSRKRMCITLKAIRPTKFGNNDTVYTKSECRNFFLEPRDLDKLKKEASNLKHWVSIQKQAKQILFVLNIPELKLADSFKLTLIKAIINQKSVTCGDCGWPLDEQERCYNFDCIRTTTAYLLAQKKRKNKSQ